MPPTHLLDAAGLQADFLANRAPGTVVLEMLRGPASAGGPRPGLGMIVNAQAGELMLLPFSPWSTLSAKPGQLTELRTETGIVIPEVSLRAEIDITASAPRTLSLPTGQHPPILTVRNGVPLILAVLNPKQASQRVWVAYDLQGVCHPHYSTGNNITPMFDEWVLVLTRNGKRSELRVQ